MPQKEVRTCRKHGETLFFAAKATNVKGGIRWRCERCVRATGRARRRRIKAMLVAEHGGKCQRCGYDRCVGAMHFHHRDKSQKEYHVSSRALDAARREAAKCDLLCSNCHYEIEWGLEGGDPQHEAVA